MIKNPAGPGSVYGLFLSDPPGAEPVRFEPFPLLHLVTPTRLAWAANSAELLVFTAGTGRSIWSRSGIRASGGSLLKAGWMCRGDWTLASRWWHGLR